MAAESLQENNLMRGPVTESRAEEATGLGLLDGTVSPSAPRVEVGQVGGVQGPGKPLWWIRVRQEDQLQVGSHTLLASLWGSCWLQGFSTREDGGHI